MRELTHSTAMPSRRIFAMNPMMDKKLVMGVSPVASYKRRLRPSDRAVNQDQASLMEVQSRTAGPSTPDPANPDGVPIRNAEPWREI